MVDIALLFVSLVGMIFSAAAQAQPIKDTSVKLLFITTWLLSGAGVIIALINLFGR